MLNIIFIFLETRNRRSGIFQQFQRIHGRSSRYVRRYVYRAGSTAHRDTTNVISRVPIFFASFLPSLLPPRTSFPSRAAIPLFSLLLLLFFFFSFSLSLFFFSPRAMHMIIVVGNRQSIDARRCRPFPPPTAGPPPTCPTVYIPFQFNSYISRHLLAHSALEILLSLPIIIYRYARERERERARREKEKKIPEVISNVHNVFLLLRETRSLSYSVFCYWRKKHGRVVTRSTLSVTDDVVTDRTTFKYISAYISALS